MQIVGKKLSRASARAGGTEAMLENGISAMKGRVAGSVGRKLLLTVVLAQSERSRRWSG